MCKALLISGEADCADLEDEEDPACITNLICQEIINVQNAQIQTMRGVLDQINSTPTADCVITIDSTIGGPPIFPPVAAPVASPTKSSKKSKTKVSKNTK